MNHLKTFAQLNEAEKKEAKKVDYAAKYAKRIEEASELIKKAKEDDVYAVEYDSTVEQQYIFKSISVVKNKLCVKYKEVHGKEDTNTADLKDADAVNYLLGWVKKCIAKGRRHEAKEQKREDKENSK